MNAIKINLECKWILKKKWVCFKDRVWHSVRLDDCLMMLGNKEFVYSKEGFKEFEVLINQKKFNYLNTRTRYCVMIQFEVKGDIWNV